MIIEKKKASAIPPPAWKYAPTAEQQPQIDALALEFARVRAEYDVLRVPMDALRARGFENLSDDERTQLSKLHWKSRPLPYKMQSLVRRIEKIAVARVPMTIAESTVEQLQTAIERIEILDYLAQFGVTEETLLRRTESVNEYAHRTGVPSRTVRKGCAKGLIHAVKHFGEWRIMPAAHLLQGEWEPQQVAA